MVSAWELARKLTKDVLEVELKKPQKVQTAGKIIPEYQLK